jgi:pyridoxal phosphate-dependent aminotransferase EpsN
MRARVMEQLMRQGIECRRLWKPLHQQPLAAGSLFFQDGNGAEYLYERGLCLPSGYTLTTLQQSHIAELIMKALGA